MKSIQLKFQNKSFKISKEFGGTLLKKGHNPREKRPISTRHSMHLVLRSSQAKGAMWMLKKKNAFQIKTYLNKYSKKYGVVIYEFSNVGNHLHLLIRVTNRFSYGAFIKAFTGAIAVSISGSSKNKKLKMKFWDYRPWTRVIESWGRAYAVAKRLCDSESFGSDWNDSLCLEEIGGTRLICS